MTETPKDKKAKKRKRILNQALLHLNFGRFREGFSKTEEEKEPEKSPERKKLEAKADVGLIRASEIRKNLGERKQRAEMRWKTTEDGWANRAAGTGDEGGRGRSR